MASWLGGRVVGVEVRRGRVVEGRVVVGVKLDVDGVGNWNCVAVAVVVVSVGVVAGAVGAVGAVGVASRTTPIR